MCSLLHRFAKLSTLFCTWFGKEFINDAVIISWGIQLWVAEVALGSSWQTFEVVALRSSAMVTNRIATVAI